jgi:hypothetical protein
MSRSGARWAGIHTSYTVVVTPTLRSRGRSAHHAPIRSRWTGRATSWSLGRQPRNDRGVSDRTATAGLVPGAIDDWLDRTGARGRAPDVPPELARAHARLGLAVFRGLLLDLVGTGDRAGVDAAFEAYTALAAATSGPSAPVTAASGRSHHVAASEETHAAS